jgi:hypothetical protein
LRHVTGVVYLVCRCEPSTGGFVVREPVDVYRVPEPTRVANCPYRNIQMIDSGWRNRPAALQNIQSSGLEGRP